MPGITSAVVGAVGVASTIKSQRDAKKAQDKAIKQQQQQQEKAIEQGGFKIGYLDGYEDEFRYENDVWQANKTAELNQIEDLGATQLGRTQNLLDQILDMGQPLYDEMSSERSYRTFTEDLAQQQFDADDYSRRLTDQQDRLQAEQQDVYRRLDELEPRGLELDEQLDALEAERQYLSARVEEAGGQFTADQQNRLQAIDEQLNSLETERQGLAERHDELNQRVAALDDYSVRLTTQQDNLQDINRQILERDAYQPYKDRADQLERERLRNYQQDLDRMLTASNRESARTSQYGVFSPERRDEQIARLMQQEQDVARDKVHDQVFNELMGVQTAGRENLAQDAAIFNQLQNLLALDAANLASEQGTLNLGYQGAQLSQDQLDQARSDYLAQLQGFGQEQGLIQEGRAGVQQGIDRLGQEQDTIRLAQSNVELGQQNLAADQENMRAKINNILAGAQLAPQLGEIAERQRARETAGFNFLTSNMLANEQAQQSYENQLAEVLNRSREIEPSYYDIKNKYRYQTSGIAGLPSASRPAPAASTSNTFGQVADLLGAGLNVYNAWRRENPPTPAPTQRVGMVGTGQNYSNYA